MKIYIIPPEKGGEGVYGLVTEEGEGLASHLCSSVGFARGDLEGRRPERQKEWKKRFGDYEILHLGDDDMTRENLVHLNDKWYKEYKKSEKKK
jgi:hypothetical protein